eukprot:791109-Prymnesium_polylepis.1
MVAPCTATRGRARRDNQSVRGGGRAQRSGKRSRRSGKHASRTCDAAEPPPHAFAVRADPSEA